jgi:phosphate/sulfate permease
LALSDVAHVPVVTQALGPRVALILMNVQLTTGVVIASRVVQMRLGPLSVVLVHLATRVTVFLDVKISTNAISALPRVIHSLHAPISLGVIDVAIVRKAMTVLDLQHVQILTNALLSPLVLH